MKYFILIIGAICICGCSSSNPASRNFKYLLRQTYSFEKEVYSSCKEGGWPAIRYLYHHRDRIKSHINFIDYTADTVYIIYGYNVEGGFDESIWTDKGRFTYSWDFQAHEWPQKSFSARQYKLVENWDVVTIKKESEESTMNTTMPKIIALRVIIKDYKVSMESISFRNFTNLSDVYP